MIVLCTNVAAVSAFAARKTPKLESSPDAGDQSFPSSRGDPASDGGSIQSDEELDEQPTGLVRLSTFIPTNENSLQVGNSIIYGLGLGDRLVFRGQFSITIQKGAIRLLGAVLHASPNSYPVCVPDDGTHAFPVVECIQIEDRSLIEGTRSDENDSLYEKFRTIIRIDPRTSGLERIARIAPLFKSMWANENSCEFLQDGPSTSSLFTPYRSWFDIAYKLLATSETPRILVVGPKSSGKSSFCRFLSNFLISKLGTAHYLELDPGQPQYCPPGTISLHKPDYNFGPAFSHAQFDCCIKAHSLGYTSPKDQPLLYISYAHDLFNKFQSTQKKNKQTALIINTPGWTRGLGADLLANFANYMSPTLILGLGPDDSLMEARDALGEESVITVESVLTSGESHPTRYSAADLRTLQILSYLHSQDKFARHLTEMPPYVVPYDGSAGIAIQGIAILASEGVVQEDVVLAINGTLVAIVCVAEEAAIPVTRTLEGIPWIEPNNVGQVITPETSRCLGYAVVQSIDTVDKCLRLLTPLPMKAIQQVISNKQRLILVRGRLQLPLWELWDTRTDTANSPYLSKKHTGVGSQGWRVRRNVLRRGVPS
jgi:polynucleotide 5'-hydroxyl-kinase GRC3/NOL9